VKRQWLAAVAALVVCGACGTRVKDWPDGALEPTDYYSTSATTLALGGDEHDDTPSQTTDTTRAKSKGKSDTTAATTAASGELPAPAPGTYTYDVTEDGEKRAVTIAWAVERGASSLTLTSTQTDEDDDFSVTETSTYRVTSSAFELVSTKTLYEDEEPETCTYKPAFLVLRLPLKTGTKWKATGHCADDDAGSDEEQLEFEVTGTANDVIGGKTVKTFIVRTHQSFDSTDDTTGERTSFSVEDLQHIDPATLLVVLEDVKFEFDGDKSTMHRQLRSLTPA
jgi:hypothetical protein